MANFLAKRLAKIHAAGNYRALPGAPAGIDFWSNDYLGLARLSLPASTQRPDNPTTRQPDHPTTRQPDNPTTGATGSRLISGDRTEYHAVEQMIAAYHGYPAALVFNAGYAANLGLLSAVLKRGDVLLYDELMHASCRDGIRLGQAKAYKFPHNRLGERLAAMAGAVGEGGQLFVLTEGRFSMDGDLSPLAALAERCQAVGAHLIVDEAHSGGLEGLQGAGLVAELALQDLVFATIVTYGKAFGSHGAAVLGSHALRDYLINTCRPFIYTTGPAPTQWAGIVASYEKLTREHAVAYPRLLQRITQFREGMSAAGLAGTLAPAEGPIQILYLPGNAVVMAAETACREAGLLVKGIRSPTVAAGQERLRICLHAFNTEEEVAALVRTLVEVLKT